MSRQIRLVEAALRAQMAKLKPQRSLFVAMCGTLVRAGVWALLIFSLAAIVPQVLPALKELQPKMPLPRGPVMDLVDFIRNPILSVPAAGLFLLLIDLPFGYLSTNSLVMRRWWSRLMLMVPLGIGLAAGIGFVVMYLQLIGLLVKDAGLGG